MEKVSIITICYNNIEGLCQTIDSVERLDYADKEYIIVDGGSNDGTKELLAAKTSVIDKYVSEKDDGIYDALNKGIRMATGKWIVCMNAGDVFADSKVLSDIFRETLPKDIRVIYSDYKEKQSADRVIVKNTDRSRGNVFHQSAIYQRSLHDEYGYYVVTHPYTISDLMFFLSIPEAHYYKTKHVISLVDVSGVSRQGTWVARNAICLRVVYNLDNLHTAYLRYIKYIIINSIRNLLRK